MGFAVGDNGCAPCAVFGIFNITKLLSIFRSWKSVSINREAFPVSSAWFNNMADVANATSPVLRRAYRGPRFDNFTT